ncbi:dihydrolipoyl dehydrogenase family protein [Lacinutrix salivirga]
MESIHYNVFVIGSGIAGQTVAKACADQNLTVAIADKREFGGTCANRGCDPKKVLLQFADLVNTSNKLKDKGIAKAPKIKWKDVQKFKRSFTEVIPKATEDNLTSKNITLYHQSPKFKSNNEVVVEGKLITAEYFVIATGLVPRPLTFKGSALLQNSDDILNLKSIPKSALFIGAGYIAMEFAYMLSTLGCKVTILQKDKKALTNFDTFLVEKLVKHLEENGVEFIFEAETISAEKLKKNIKLTYKHKGNTKTIKARVIYNTAGRVPATQLLDLDKANILHDSQGVHVNDYLQSLSHKNVFACGDVSNKSVPLTPLSGLQGYSVARNILKSKSKVFKHPLVPSVVFTNPKIASVGYSEAEAKSRYKAVKVFKGDASNWFNAKKSNTSVYAYKIIVNKRTSEIVGAHLLSDQAHETINSFAIAIENKMTTKAFKSLIFTYPSYSSDLKSMLAE